MDEETAAEEEEEENADAEKREERGSLPSAAENDDDNDDGDAGGPFLLTQAPLSEEDDGCDGDSSSSSSSEGDAVGSAEGSQLDDEAGGRLDKGVAAESRSEEGEASGEALRVGEGGMPPQPPAMAARANIEGRAAVDGSADADGEPRKRDEEEHRSCGAADDAAKSNRHDGNAAAGEESPSMTALPLVVAATEAEAEAATALVSSRADSGGSGGGAPSEFDEEGTTTADGEGTVMGARGRGAPLVGGVDGGGGGVECGPYVSGDDDECVGGGDHRRSDDIDGVAPVASSVKTGGAPGGGGTKGETKGTRHVQKASSSADDAAPEIPDAVRGEESPSSTTALPATAAPLSSCADGRGNSDGGAHRPPSCNSPTSDFGEKETTAGKEARAVPVVASPPSADTVAVEVSVAVRAALKTAEKIVAP
eukprot:CAMPEP_0113563720 /NCGR_PEP_ID=MMETSP0015_2-20120614/21222_1 /TAXON_ID=2838 /ORGANISM="Odontella" /LENGTH=422 /DNA_ID=CAMNT_0000465725 /DNA_START=21 /DNA_END=1287 /DNA_ORIENTATION=+ /assembly_acc=CAM_ASM_000160